MIIVLSGEGPSDLGSCINEQGICVQPNFNYGPMTCFIDKELQAHIGFSLLESTPENYFFVSKTELIRLTNELKQNRKTMSLKGKKRQGAETSYFYLNAFILGKKAIELSNEYSDSVIAILFRDCDGTRSSESTLWQNKVNSIHQGFNDSKLGKRGVPMVPKPKSESWMLCVLRDNYQQCARLENLSGNDSVENSAKHQLHVALNENSSTTAQVQSLENIEINNILLAEQMPSYQAFQQSLIDAYNENNTLSRNYNIDTI